MSAAMWNDVRFAARTLRRSPVFTTAAVLSLALGIGANTAIFSLLYQVSLRALPVADSAALYLLESDDKNFGWTRSDNRRTVFSYPMYVALRQQKAAFSRLAGRTGSPVTISTGGEPARGTAEIVTGSYFELLGLTPALGRLLTEEDEARENSVVVLGYRYWETRLARDPGILNRTILLNGSPVTVVGVGPHGFAGLLSGQTPDVFAPASMMPLIVPGWDRARAVDGYWLNVIGRLAPGISPEQARAAILPVFRSTLHDHVEQMQGISDREAMLRRPLTLEPASRGLNVLEERWQRPLLVLLAMVALVLLIACANLAGLMLIRVVARRREIAVRFALGATARQVARQLIAESLLVSFAGGLLGVLLCGVLTEGLLRLLPEDANGGWLRADIDWRLLAFGMTLALLTGLLFSLSPLIRALRWDLAPALKENASGLTAPDRQTVARQAFVAAQIAVSVLLLAGAGLLARTLANLTAADPGFRPEQLVTFSVQPALSGYSPSRTLSALDDLEVRLRALPGVSSVARALVMPFGGAGIGNGVRAPGSRSAGDKFIACIQNAVSAGYFRTLGTPLLAGREFTQADSGQAPKVAILNETFARFLFETQSAIGRRIILGSSDSELEIVGIVRDAKSSSLRETPGRFLFVPFEQAEPGLAGSATFFLRAEGRVEPLMAAVGRAVKGSLPGVPLERLASMDVVISRSMSQERLLAWMAAGFATLAVILAAIGLYGVVAYSTARRVREFGIRLAVGAEPASLRALVLREAASVTLLGLLVGLLASYAAARALESQLYGVAAHDPVAFGAAALLIGAVTGGAALAPATRAMRTDPLSALRSA